MEIVKHANYKVAVNLMSSESMYEAPDLCHLLDGIRCGHVWSLSLPINLYGEATLMLAYAISSKGNDLQKCFLSGCQGSMGLNTFLVALEAAIARYRT